MTPKPQPVERLEKRLARVAREHGLDQERLRRWVSFLALCGVLERAMQEQILGSYFLKGGVALELRFATRARATKDLDLGLEGPRGSRVDLFQRALGLGFDAFTFRLKAQTRDMEQADTVRARTRLVCGRRGGLGGVTGDRGGVLSPSGKRKTLPSTVWKIRGIGRPSVSDVPPGGRIGIGAHHWMPVRVVNQGSRKGRATAARSRA
jgi:hypothetical protein